MGLPGAHAGPRIHPIDRRRPLQRRLHDQLEVERVSREFSGAPAIGRASPPAGAAASEKDKDPVAICRLKRVAADYKDDITRPDAEAAWRRTASASRWSAAARPRSPWRATSRRSATTAPCSTRTRKSGGMMRSQIPKFRLPDAVIDEECDYILDLGIEFVGGKRIDSLKALLAEGYDAMFVGSGAPRGRELDIPGRKEAAKNIHIGIDWLSSVSFGHTTKIGKRVIVLGGGNTAMDCCRSSRRLGGEDVKVIVRSGFEEMKASPWEKEDAMHEDIPILNFLVPKEFTHDNGKLTGVVFEKVKAEYDAKGRRNLVPTGEPDQHFECDDVLVAVGQENAFPWIERDIGIEFDKWDMPKVDAATMASTNPEGVLRRRQRVRPEEHHLGGGARPRRRALDPQDADPARTSSERPLPDVQVSSQKMGIHEWSYDNDISGDKRFRVPLRDKVIALKDIRAEVELGFDPQARLRRGAALPELRRADRFHVFALHRVRRLRRHLPDGLHHLHSQRRGSRPAHAPQGARSSISCRTSMSPTASRPATSWSRTRTSACTAACAPSAAPPVRGTCRNISST